MSGSDGVSFGSQKISPAQEVNQKDSVNKSHSISGKVSAFFQRKFSTVSPVSKEPLLKLETRRSQEEKVKKATGKIFVANTAANTFEPVSVEQISIFSRSSSVTSEETLRTASPSIGRKSSSISPLITNKTLYSELKKIQLSLESLLDRNYDKSDVFKQVGLVMDRLYELIDEISEGSGELGSLQVIKMDLERMLEKVANRPTSSVVVEIEREINQEGSKEGKLRILKELKESLEDQILMSKEGLKTINKKKEESSSLAEREMINLDAVFSETVLEYSERKLEQINIEYSRLEGRK